MRAYDVVRGALVAVVICGAFGAPIGVRAAGAAKPVTLDREAIHAQAVEESLRPIHPGIPGKRAFWNARASTFMYAPAFHVEPVKGAAAYRFTATSYGTRWSFDAENPGASLAPVWKELPDGDLLVECTPLLPPKGTLRISYRFEDLKKRLRPFTKAAGAAKPPSFDFAEAKDAAGYRITVRQVRQHVFEADDPCAPLAPIWKDIPVGYVVLKIEGLDRKGGRVLHAAKIGTRHARQTREFYRQAVFNGPYHEAALDYTETARRWLRWTAAGPFKHWEKEGEKVSGYPSKFVGAAISGLTALAATETDPGEKKKALQMARNAARTIIKCSFPADWPMAHCPPTYSDKEYHIVMMQYPAGVGGAYLDLYEATKEKEFLDAAVRIAEMYRKTQLPDGTWHLLMDGKTGEKPEKCTSPVMPLSPMTFLSRIAGHDGLEEYRLLAEKAWKWLEKERVADFRFEGQFEDTCREGGSSWNLSPLPANAVARYLFQQAGDDPSLVALAEDALRQAEDQFVIWDQAPDHNQFTPCALEQYKYMVSINGSAMSFVDTYRMAYETTGKDIYLAKAIAFANAATVLFEKSGGYAVSVYWKIPTRSIGGSWPNCHTYCAGVLARLGNTFRERNLR